ncbi:MAG: hypothetical protein ACI4IW_06500 [Oscillospiraceae bacterium]
MEVHVIMRGRGATQRVITATADKEAADRIAAENYPSSIITFTEDVLNRIPTVPQNEAEERRELKNL